MISPGSSGRLVLFTQYNKSSPLPAVGNEMQGFDHGQKKGGMGEGSLPPPW